MVGVNSTSCLQSTGITALAIAWLLATDCNWPAGNSGHRRSFSCYRACCVSWCRAEHCLCDWQQQCYGNQSQPPCFDGTLAVLAGIMPLQARRHCRRFAARNMLHISGRQAQCARLCAHAVVARHVLSNSSTPVEGFTQPTARPKDSP